jgi:hypothetical protein
VSDVGAVRAVADAVLYEGYILYPYRASAQKNRSRWQFGVVMPAAYVEGDPSEKAAVQTECVLENSESTSIEVVLRFLHVQRRTGVGTTVPDWDEAVEREIRLVVHDLLAGARHEFAIPGGSEVEDLADGGRVTRRRAPLAGALAVSLEPLPGPWRIGRLRVRVENTGVLSESGAGRDAALPSAFLAAHLILAARDGAFVSMIDPPEWGRPAVESCDNIGVWPVLGGPAGDRTLMLAAPIILYDHPELAPESPGDLYDGTEIDEILTLRTLAMSDDEKREARATDPRAAAVIDRTESLDAEAMARLHGTIREMRILGPPAAAPEESPPWWDPGVDASVSPSTDAVYVNGVRVARGSRVVLRPGARRADAQDMFLNGRDAVVEAVLIDVDDNVYVAVTLADDPAGDLLRSHGRFLYFAPDEVEPSEAGSEVIP